MRAVVATGPGGPEVLELREWPEPVPGPAELLVGVRATAVNRADVNQRKGTYALPPGSTDVLGLEIAGEVLACGPDAVGWSVGDRVCGVVPGGGHAELAVLPASIALPVPENLTMEDAAALPEVLLTAYDNIVRRGRLAPGGSLLVHGGSSGIGTAAVQLARLRGARVFVTCSSAAKIEACLALGASAGIDYRTEDFVARVRELTDGRGVDVVLDHIGGPYLQRNLDALAMDGCLSIIATMGGSRGELDVAALMGRRVWVTGSRLRPRTLPEKTELVAEVLRELWPALVTGELRPVVDSVRSWEQIADAHRRMESGQHIGKIVLSVHP